MGMFVKNIDAAYRMKIFLERFSINSAVLNSELPHATRQNIIQAFNQSLVELLIATDEGIRNDLVDEEADENEDDEGQDEPGKTENVEQKRNQTKRKRKQEKASNDDAI